MGGLLGERELLLALAVRPHRGCSFDDDSLRASDQTVKNGVSYGRIAAAKIIVPTVHGQLTGHQSRSTSGALLNNFQQVTAAHRVERVNAKVI